MSKAGTSKKGTTKKESTAISPDIAASNVSPEPEASKVDDLKKSSIAEDFDIKENDPDVSKLELKLL